MGALVMFRDQFTVELQGQKHEVLSTHSNLLLMTDETNDIRCFGCKIGVGDEFEPSIVDGARFIKAYSSHPKPKYARTIGIEKISISRKTIKIKFDGILSENDVRNMQSHD